MNRIQQLTPDVINKIAAGEVIERPASVVKELLENSLDAGATRIDIDLEAGGTELIRIVDNGHGIAAEDLPLAFAPHATSKLRSAEELFEILTLGFRGEALASIGAVAKVTLQSRPAGQANGAEIRNDGGILSEVRPWGGSFGTRIEVRHIFSSVPARKKFLKSVATEQGRVTDEVEKLALSHPGLHVVLRHNNKLVYEIPGTASFTDRVGFFFGADVRDALYAIDSGPGPVRVSGWIGDPAMDRGNAKLQYLFVNGRWFRDRNLAYAIQEAYRGLLMTGRYAIAFLFLEVPPDQVDVNAHPTKAEVRFRDQSLLFSLIRKTIKARLEKENLLPKLVPIEPSEQEPLPVPEPQLFSPRRETAASTLAPWERQTLPEAVAFRPMPSARPPQPLPFSATTTAQIVQPPEAIPYSPPKVLESQANLTPHSDLATVIQAEPERELKSEPEPEPEAEPKFELPTIPIGSALQIHDSYLVLETDDGMMVIDQHALHERILYEQLRSRVRCGKLEVQRLLIPEPIELPAAHVAAVIDAKDALAELGLEVSEFGGNTILLSSYPTLTSRRAPHEILQAAVDYLVTNDVPPAKEVLLNHLLATMACKAAVKAGDKLSNEEISYLLQLRKLAEDSHHCPHGRPTTLVFSRQDLDKQFRRI